MPINQLSPRPSNVLFIDESYLKNTTDLDQNVDNRLLRPSIQYMQDKYILPILGNNIFEQWKQWINSGVTLSGNPSSFFPSNGYDLTLLTTWVQPCLAACVMIELVRKVSLQIKNKGVLQAHSEFSTTATDAQLNWLSENYRETAAFYGQRITQYLMNSPEIWPNWLNPQINTTGAGADLFYPERTKYFTGIHVPGLAGSQGGGNFGQGSGWGLSLSQKIEIFGNTY